MTITANNVERKYGDANPTITASYAVTTWVNESDAIGFTTAPKVKIDASYDNASAVGTYPDGVVFDTKGIHPLYDITHKKGELTIKQATGVISNTNLPSALSYGDVSASLTGSHAGEKNDSNKSKIY